MTITEDLFLNRSGEKVTGPDCNLRIDQCFVFQTLWRSESRISETHRCILFSDAGYDLYKYRDIFSDHVDQPMVPETMANDRDDTDSVCDHPCMDMGFQIYLFKIISGKETSGDLWRP